MPRPIDPTMKAYRPFRTHPLVEKGGTKSRRVSSLEGRVGWNETRVSFFSGGKGRDGRAVPRDDGVRRCQRWCATPKAQGRRTKSATWTIRHLRAQDPNETTRNNPGLASLVPFRRSKSTHSNHTVRGRRRGTSDRNEDALASFRKREEASHAKHDADLDDPCRKCVRNCAGTSAGSTALNGRVDGTNGYNACRRLEPCHGSSRRERKGGFRNCGWLQGQDP